MRSAILSLCALVLAASPTRGDQLTHDITVPNGVPEEEGFGSAIAIDGTTALVGAHSPSRGGAAYVMERSGASWSHFRHLDPPFGLHGGSGFGAAVGLSGDEALVGAPNYDPGGAFDTGRVVYYVRQSDGEWFMKGSLPASILPAGARFGTSIDMTTIGGTTFAVVGAPRNFSAGQSGAVYVFEKTGAISWSLVTTLSAGAIGDGYGTSVAIDGQTLVVGAPYNSVLSTPPNAGRVYLYRNLDGTGQSWTFEDAEIDPLGQTGDAFGFDVDVSGSWAVVGSPYWGPFNEGALLIYERVGSSWIMRHCSGGTVGSRLGYSVSMGVPFGGAPRCVVGLPGIDRAAFWVQQPNGLWSATYTFQPSAGTGSGVGGAVGYVEIGPALPGALIGAPASDAFAPDAGQVFAYELVLIGPVVGWIPGNSFAGRWHDADDLLGAAVDGEGGLWAYGAASDDDEGGQAGAVYVYRRQTPGDPTLTPEAKLTVPQLPGSGFLLLGSSVSVGAGRVAAGAPYETTTVDRSGAVYVFGDSTGSWQQEARVVPPTEMENAYFGWSVALEDDLLIVGAIRGGPTVAESGAVHVFREQGSTWVHQTVLEPSDLTVEDFGRGLAFDGRTLVVGAPFPSAGIGAAFVFTWDGSTWTFDERLDDASFGVQSLAGETVDVQGNRLIVGGRGLLNMPGEAHLFERTTQGWIETHQFSGTLVDFGSGVAVSGEAVLIGEMPLLSSPPPGDKGTFTVYRDLGSNGVQVECTSPLGTGADSWLGGAVALDGCQAGIGAPGFASGFGPRAGQAWSVELPDIVGPVVYCQTIRDTVDCLPYIDYVGTPSFTAPPGTMTITAGNTINNKTGLMMYGFGRAEIPFLGGTLCIQPPVRRTQIQFTGGNAGPSDCSGSMTLDFTTVMQTTSDPFLAPGATVNCQYRYRDPGAAFGVAFTNALELTIAP